VKPTVARASDASALRQSPTGAPSRGRATPLRLLVLGADTADVVAGVGGLICDAVRAGLQVEVNLETVGDTRALRVLGADARNIAHVFDFESGWPDAVVFAAAVHERNPGVRRLITDAVRRHRAQIAVWGNNVPVNLPADLNRGFNHQLSVAAQAFKHHAMRAAGMAGRVSTTEPLRSERRRPAHGPSLLPLR
jgi:LmbE family N-acetylglucosaminyl deacetylase